MLIQIFESFFSVSFPTTSNLTCTDPILFFHVSIPFFLFWIIVLDIGPSKTSSSKISDSITRKSWNIFAKTRLSYFLVRVEKLMFLVFFGEIRGLSPYIRSGSRRIRFFETWRKYGLSYFSFWASCLTSLSFSLFSASCLFFSTFFKLKTQAPWLLYTISVCWTGRFFHILTASSSILV